MKLKYFLRALGIGIVVTTILMGVSENPTISDEVVRERAQKLGMIDGSSLLLSDLQENSKDTEENTPKSEQTEIPLTKEDDNNEETDKEMILQDDINNADDMQNTEVVPEEAVDGKNNAEPDSSTQDVVETPEEEKKSDIIIIRIPGGASSVSVSRQLEQEGLVDDATEYDRFLCANGYDKVISVGTYEIPWGSSEEEIAKIITKRK